MGILFDDNINMLLQIFDYLLTIKRSACTEEYGYERLYLNQLNQHDQNEDRPKNADGLK